MGVETNEGLSRMYEVSVPAADIQKRLDERIEEIRPQMNLKGFRPGKVPASHVKKMFGKSIMGEVVQALVEETSQKAIADAEVRPAGQPEMEMESDMEAVLEGKADLAYKMHVDIMPEFEPTDIKKLKVTKPVAEISDEEIEERLGQIAESNQQYDKRAKTAKARDKDAVVMDFVGKTDGEAFEGGAAENHTLVLGSGSFIPGFEDQLVGAKAGDELEVNVTFPEDYQADHLAGKEAVFEVKVHEVRAPKTPEVDEDFAKGLGLESLDKLKEIVTQQIQSEFDGASRAKAKRALLDLLDEKHDFDLPPKMVDQEFDQIWQQLQTEMDAGRTAEEDKDKSEDELKEEYRKIAERRVRLGLVLAEIGREAEITIAENEVQQALINEARNFPGQERQVIEFFQQNPNAMAQLRAPIYEDKVVDHIMDVAKVEEKTVSKDELLKEDEE
ncbi:trigger factor [Hyphomonas sp. FCG-A18]|uniref:trigger factor n=1 Tax=Hyphomonas sp. FCG-A18 TaxID=3080019 RepID=UPI002B2954AA|nr:trigger factor [Hyphomonas sp. FCG-A18]